VYAKKEPESRIGGVARVSACSVLPVLAGPPHDARSVLDFGATRDDARDDTEAIQRALSRLKPNEWLVFPPGRYLHSKRLRVTVPGTKLWGAGATLHATNPRDQAMTLMANGTGIYNFTLTADTDKRGTTPWEARITVHGGGQGFDVPAINDVEIRGNRLLGGAAASGGDDVGARNASGLSSAARGASINSASLHSAATNSASAAGIFLYRAHRFLIAENFIERTLADGIHVTAGSAHGRIVNNVVRETGDDMIGIVSYLGGKVSAEEAAANLDERVAHNLNHDIVIEGNHLAGQYWGRGIAIAGARDLTVRANRIEDTTMAAAIYIAREISYLTFGVRNVVIEDNVLRRVQTTTPTYVAASAPPGRRKTGHGAIEVFAQVFDDEAAIPALAAQLAVRGVRIERNVIEETASDAIRIGENIGRALSSDFQTLLGMRARPYSGVEVTDVSVLDNRISKARGRALQVNTAAKTPLVACAGNFIDNKAAKHQACGALQPAVSGAALACLR
jgi:polygalacturonase